MMGSDRSQAHIWWLGQSGFLLQWDRRHLLIDPYLSDSLTKKYQNTDKPHIRMTERVIKPEELDFIDVVTSSHNHTDHLDAETLIPLIKVNPDIQMIIPEANRDFVAERIGQPAEFPVGLNAGESKEVAQFKCHGIPAAHNEIDKDEKDRCRYLGYVIEFNGHTVYHSGDTLWHEEIIEALKPFDIDVALLPINGNKPERRVAGNLDPKEAVAFARTVHAGCIIPCHYEMFTFNTADPIEVEVEAIKAGQEFKILKCGERYSF